MVSRKHNRCQDIGGTEDNGSDGPVINVGVQINRNCIICSNHAFNDEAVHGATMMTRKGGSGAFTIQDKAVNNSCCFIKIDSGCACYLDGVQIN